MNRQVWHLYKPLWLRRTFPVTCADTFSLGWRQCFTAFLHYGSANEPQSDFIVTCVWPKRVNRPEEGQMAAGCLPLWAARWLSRQGHLSALTCSLVRTSHPMQTERTTACYFPAEQGLVGLRPCPRARKIKRGWRKSMAIRGVRQGERERGCRGRARVRRKRRGLNKASGPHKAELSDILINNCSSIKGQAIGRRQRNCSAVAVSPRRSDSTFWNRVGWKRATETDGCWEWRGIWDEWKTRQSEGGGTITETEGWSKVSVMDLPVLVISCHRVTGCTSSG